MAFSTNNVVQGDNLMIFDENKKSLAMATSHTLSKTLATNEINCKDTGIGTCQTAGKISWEISTENLYSDGQFSTLNNKMNNRQPVMAYFGSSYFISGTVAPTAEPRPIDGIDGVNEKWSLDTTHRYSYGQVLITSLSITASSGDNATMSATFTGCGAIHDV